MATNLLDFTALYRQRMKALLPAVGAITATS